MSGPEQIKEVVRQRYAAAALTVVEGARGSCCGEAGGCCDPVSANLYGPSETKGLPQQAILASLGCGNPTALAELEPGQTVLDLGSGGGIDVLLSARRVAPGGKAYGLDMTDEMLALARENQRQAGVTNVEFLKGEIEHIPLPDASVDVIISNCVINLSSDKRQTLWEAFRVLRPGGRLAISDVVVRGEVPAEVRKSMELWAGCVAGALEEREYERLLAEAGFEGIGIEPTRIYAFEGARALLAGAGLESEVLAREVGGRIMGAFIRATKPAVAAHDDRAGARILEVFDPAMCCATGVCGAEVDPRLPQFAADLEWVATQGVQVARHNLAQEPAAFVANAAVRDLIGRWGSSCLPLVLHNDKIQTRGRYPSRAELAAMVGISATAR